MDARPVALLAALALAAAALAGCSGDDADEADGAHTTACRTYELGVAAQDDVLVDLLTRAARSGSWDIDPINDAIAAVGGAAEDAGLVAGLSDEDFETFSDLVTATGTAYTRANPQGGPGVDRETVATLSTAIDAVRSACSTD